MGYEAERQAIESRFETQWASATSIDFDNVDFVPTPGTSFVRLTILDGDSRQVSLGDSPLYRSIGVIIISIFTPLDIGSATGRTLADNAAAIFRGWQSSGIVCRSPSIQRVGKTNGWFQYNVNVPFYRDESF